MASEPMTRHPCHGRTLTMQRCFDAIATTGRPIGAAKTLASLMVHHLVRQVEFETIRPGPTQIGVPIYEPTPEAKRQWDEWRKANADQT